MLFNNRCELLSQKESFEMRGNNTSAARDETDNWRKTCHTSKIHPSTINVPEIRKISFLDAEIYNFLI